MSKDTVIVDASLLKNSACRLRMFYEGYLGLKGKVLGNDLHFGTAFHLFRSVYRITNDWNKAFIEAHKCFKNGPENLITKDNKKYLTPGFLTTCMAKYEEKYDPTKDRLVPVIDEHGDTLVEPKSRFIFPYFITDDVDILIAGTMDEMSYQHQDGPYTQPGYVITDCKTSGAWKIREFFEGFKLSPQLLMYRWAIRKYAQFLPNSIWAKIDASPTTAAMIEGVFYKSSSDEDSGASVSITRSDRIYFKDEQLLDFEFLVRRKCQQLAEDIMLFRRQGVLPYREGMVNDACNTKFGLCPYFQLCCARDDEERESLVEANFVKKKYNPLAFS